MDKFFNSFGSYYKDAQLDTLSFWVFPVGTIVLIWLMAILIPKVFNRKQKLKTVFIINRAWIAGSSVVAAIIIGLICFWWTKNYFAEHPWQFPLLLSLFIAMLISLIALYKLRNYYSTEGIKEITDQPKTPSQLDKAISFLKKAFSRSKLFILLPAMGFCTLLFVLNKGTNLISIILDNTPSQGNSFSDAKTALNQTISQLDNNNQIIITSFSGNRSSKQTFDEIIKIAGYSPSVDNSASFTSKTDATNFVSSLNLLPGGTTGSAILETIWQNFLFAKQNTGELKFKNKILLVITDGVENAVPVIANKFFCNAEEFTNYFPVENIFFIDYFNTEGQSTDDLNRNNLFMQNATNCGYDVQKGNTKDDYSFALEQILTGFQNNWYLIYWTIAIFAIMIIIGLLINPKKIA